jgi:hypothetical protein
MKKPTLIDVENYFCELGLSGQGEIFYDHYESNGWMVGKTKMKDWGAAVRQWKRRYYQFNKQPESKIAQLNKLHNEFQFNNNPTE